MSDSTKIEWCDTTLNVVTGCNKVSTGCKNCFAERMWTRLSAKNMPYEGREFTDVQCHPDRLEQPLHWKKPRKVFVNSMSDLFHDHIPPEFIAKVFATMFIAKQHTFQVLTKRPENMFAFLNYPHFKVMINAELLKLGHRVMSDSKHEWPLSNCWIGVSVENQETANERIPFLLETPAAVRFLSCEPLLGPIDFFKSSDHWYKNGYTPWRNAPILTDIHWVIVGSESGPKARPMHPDWVRCIRDQCVLDARVPFFMKQFTNDKGRKIPMDQWPEDLKTREYPINSQR